VIEPFTIRPGPTFESYRYVGPEGELEFEVGTEYWGRKPVLRHGHEIDVIPAESLRRVGDRSGDALDSESIARVLENIRHYYRQRALPLEIRHPSGQIEDESGDIRPGFKTALPRAEHSEGWSVTDLYMSPAFPDPDAYPPTVTYQGPDGEAAIIRELRLVDAIPVGGGFASPGGKVRRRVLVADSLRWTRDRAGQDMTDEDRLRILNRIRSVYDKWGHFYDVSGGPKKG
jgi:hypothetical protein